MALRLQIMLMFLNRRNSGAVNMGRQRVESRHIANPLRHRVDYEGDPNARGAHHDTVKMPALPG
jgi:hypothetical protein